MRSGSAQKKKYPLLRGTPHRASWPRLLAPLALGFLLGPIGRAEATPPSFVGVRAMGMGGALRGIATGDAGPTLNPSGMSQSRTYVIEGAYQYLSDSSLNLFHGSLVDSISNSFIAAGISYNYQRAPIAPGQELRAHDGGLSLSVLAGPRASFGGTVKYLRIHQDGANGTDGVTFDVGATLKPVDGWSLAVVGMNLRDLSTPQAPVALTGGIAFTAVNDLILDVDVLHDFGKEIPGRAQHTGVVAGGEYLVAHRVAVRLGGGRDPFAERGFFTAGLGIFNDIGAIDVGWRQDLSGSSPQSYAAIGARLFVPEAQAAP